MVEHDGQPVLQQGRVEADVELPSDLPRDVGIGCAGLKHTLHFGVAAEYEPATEPVGGQILPFGDAVVPRLAPRGAQLQIVEQRDAVAEERLLGDAPSHRHGREEPETLVDREDVRAVVASHQLDQVLVLEGVVDAREVVLPRRDPRRATAGLPEIAAGEQLVHLIRYEVVTEPSEARAVFLLTLGPGQDADRVPPELAVIFGDQVQQNAGGPQVPFAELGRAESPLACLQHRLAIRVA